MQMMYVIFIRGVVGSACQLLLIFITESWNDIKVLLRQGQWANLSGHDRRRGIRGVRIERPQHQRVHALAPWQALAEK